MHVQSMQTYMLRRLLLVYAAGAHAAHPGNLQVYALPHVEVEDL